MQKLTAIIGVIGVVAGAVALAEGTSPPLTPSASNAKSSAPQCENQTYSHVEYTGKYLGAVTERSLFPLWTKFIQETKGDTLGSNQVGPTTRIPRFAHFARLCNGNIVVVGQFDNSSSSDPHLKATFFDDNFHPLGEWFRIAHPDEQQWEHSVAALSHGGFVTTWKSSTKLMKGPYHVNIRARIFDATGNPLTDSFFATYPNEAYKDTDATNATVYGLPNGGFVLIFIRSGAGNFLRIVNSKGLPVTPEIQFAKYNDFAVHPIVFITSDGTINIFLPEKQVSRVNQPIKSAYTFNSDGEKLIETKDIKEMNRFSGYQDVIENLGFYL